MKIKIVYSDNESKAIQQLANAFNMEASDSIGIHQKTLEEICKNNVRISSENANVEYYRNEGNCTEMDVNEDFTIAVLNVFMKFHKMVMSAFTFFITGITSLQTEFFSDEPSVTQNGKASNIVDAFIKMDDK